MHSRVSAEAFKLTCAFCFFDDAVVSYFGKFTKHSPFKLEDWK